MLQQISSEVEVIVIVGFALEPQILDTGSLQPISGRVHGAPATETVGTGSIPVRSNLRLLKLGFAASLLDVQQLKGQCEASTVCGRQVAA